MSVGRSPCGPFEPPLDHFWGLDGSQVGPRRGKGGAARFLSWDHRGAHHLWGFLWPADDDCEHFIFLNTECFSSFKFNSIVIWCSICFTEVLFQFASTFQLVVLDLCFAQHPSYSSTNEYLRFYSCPILGQYSIHKLHHDEASQHVWHALLSSDHPSFLMFQID